MAHSRRILLSKATVAFWSTIGVQRVSRLTRNTRDTADRTENRAFFRMKRKLRRLRLVYLFARCITMVQAAVASWNYVTRQLVSNENYRNTVPVHGPSFQAFQRFIRLFPWKQNYRGCIYIAFRRTRKTRWNARAPCVAPANFAMLFVTPSIVRSLSTHAEENKSRPLRIDLVLVLAWQFRPIKL